MGKSEFFAKYDRPEWQMKRLEIMQRAECQCELCGDKESRLEIHHSYYMKDTDPWDYPSESLHCLCSQCHKTMQAYMNMMKEMFGLLTLENTLKVFGYIQGTILSQGSHLIFTIKEQNQARGFCDVEYATFDYDAFDHLCSEWKYTRQDLG